MSRLDAILSPQIMNEDTCPECCVNFAQAKADIQKLFLEVANEADTADEDPIRYLKALIEDL